MGQRGNGTAGVWSEQIINGRRGLHDGPLIQSDSCEDEGPTEPLLLTLVVLMSAWLTSSSHLPTQQS